LRNQLSHQKESKLRLCFLPIQIWDHGSNGLRQTQFWLLIAGYILEILEILFQDLEHGGIYYRNKNVFSKKI
jgi:hypothetical protein